MPETRNQLNPNKRVQDGWKEYWLCGECEQERLGKHETTFATKLFHPTMSDAGVRVPYGRWLLKFCVSISWRLLKHRYDDPTGLSHINAVQRGLAQAALCRWADFLLDRVQHPSIFEQHLLRWDAFDADGVNELPNNFSRYILRSVEMDIVSVGDKSGMTYGKIGPFMVFGFIGKQQHKWKGTKVHVQSGIIRPERIVLPGELLEYFKTRAVKYAAVSDGISDRQLEKIDEAVRGNIERVRNSLTFKAMLNDERLFGTDAVIRQPKANV